MQISQVHVDHLEKKKKNDHNNTNEFEFLDLMAYMIKNKEVSNILLESDFVFPFLWFGGGVIFLIKIFG